MTSPTFTNGHALLIGVGADLPVTVNDARALHDILIDGSRAGYPAGQVDLRTEAGARREHIREGFERLIARAKTNAESTVIVYFSGHGYRVEWAGQPAEHYLLPNGYKLEDLGNTAITAQEFTGYIEAIQARKLIVLLDCCHAGAMPDLKAPGATIAKVAVPPELLSALDSGSGRVVVASSTQEEFSFALKNASNSVFTTCLIEALSGKANQEPDGYARVLNVLIYLFEQVPKRTKQQQHPFVKKVLDLGDNFPLCYAGGAVGALASKPAIAKAPVISDRKRRLLQIDLDSFQEAYDLLSGLVRELRKATPIHPDVITRYYYMVNLAEKELELAKLADKLDEIESALQQFTI